jgi:hypothetical protein
LIAVDWLMSLDPDFASSGFGLYILSIQMSFALALAIAAVCCGADPAHRDVLGGVLLTAVSLWAYLGFMQYLIIWSGDLKPGAAWYLRRAGAGWAVVGWLAVALRLAPGALLIFGHVRRNGRALAGIAACIAAGAVLEVAWLALPGAAPTAGAADLVLFAVAALGLGALTLGLYGLAPARREAAP